MYLCFAFAIQWLSYTLFEQEGVSSLYKVFLVEMALAVFINVVLNFLWSYLITRQLYRVIFRGPEADKTFGGDDQEDTKVDGLDEPTRAKRNELEMKKILDPEQPPSDLS